MLKDKSRTNLKAGEALSTLGLTDAAANRYYYALYQAAVHRLTALGWTPDRIRSGAVEWGHGMVLQSVYLVRRRRSDHELYEFMRALRELADYDADSIDAVQLANRVADVRQFVEEVTA